MPNMLTRITGLTAGVLFAAAAQAEAPMVKEQAPGYYRTMLGNFEITALSDGTVKLPVDKLLLNETFNPRAIFHGFFDNMLGNMHGNAFSNSNHLGSFTHGINS